MYVVLVGFVVDADTPEAAAQITRDHLSIAYRGEYQGIADVLPLHENEPIHMFPLTAGVVPLRPVPRELVLPHFEGSRFLHDE